MQVGKYELIRELAIGGMAEVFLARTSGPMGFEKQLVLERILPHLAKDPAFVQMFLSEATLAARLTHPNIVQIFDFGEAQGAYFLAMEYIDGPTLRSLLDDAYRLQVALPAVECARIIANACEGLAFAHDFREPATRQPLGLVHFDIQPGGVISLQGKRLGAAPLGPIQMPSGTYHFRVTNQRLKKRVDMKVEVKADDVTYVQLDLLSDAGTLPSGVGPDSPSR